MPNFHARQPNYISKQQEKNKELLLKKKEELLTKIKESSKTENNIEKIEPDIQTKQQDKLVAGLYKTIKKNKQNYLAEQKKHLNYIADLKDENKSLENRLKNAIKKIIQLNEEVYRLENTPKLVENSEEITSQIMIERKIDALKGRQKEVINSIKSDQNKLISKVMDANEKSQSDILSQLEILTKKLSNLEVKHETDKVNAVVESFDRVKSYQLEIKSLKNQIKSMNKTYDELLQNHQNLKVEMKNANKWLNIKKAGPKTLLHILSTFLTPKHFRKLDDLVQIVNRYNKLVESSKVLDIWQICVGVIKIIDQVPYIEVENELLPITDLNGFIHLKDGQRYEGLYQKFSRVVKLTYEFKESVVLDIKEPVNKIAKPVVPIITEETFKQKEIVKTVLKGRKVLLISWHNMSSYVDMLSKYGAKVKVMDSKKHQNQVLSSLFSNKYDIAYLFINGVEHSKYYAAMKQLKNHKTIPEQIRLVFSPNPDEILEDALIVLDGKKKRNSFSMLFKYEKSS